MPTKTSPLTGLSAASAAITLEDRPYIAKVNLRGDSENQEFRSAVEKTFELSLPIVANSAVSNELYTVFWLGPNEWLVHGAEDQQQAIVGGLQTALSGVHSAVTDVSDYYVVMRMGGERAREILSKGTPFDVHPRSFPIGACVQTHYGHASILLHYVDQVPTFDIQVRWSFAEYLWNYLVDGAREYSVANTQ